MNEWALALFTNSAALPPELTRQINDWRRLPGKTAQAMAALQFLQDEIRYLGVESGPTPTPPPRPPWSSSAASAIAKTRRFYW